MPRTPAKAKGTTRKPRVKPGPKQHLTSAVMLIDSRPIRERVRKQYEKVRSDLDQARQELDRFRQQDAPSFVRWLHHHFGSILTEIRELRSRIMAQEDLILEIETEVMFTGESYASAYRNIMSDREAAEEERAQAQADPGPKTGNEKRRHGEYSQQDFFGDDNSEAPPGGDRRKKSKPLPTPPKPTLGSRIKELYRSIVRRLHPDTQKEMTSQKLEWWHQTQAAYQSGDEGQLEVILTLCELEDGADSGHSSISILQRIIEQLKRSMREIKRQLAACREDDAWNFAARKDRPQLERRLHAELIRDLGILRYQSEAREKLINKWKKASVRRKRRSSAEMDYF